MHFGGKYKAEKNDNPGAGAYNPDKGMALTKPRSYEAYFLSYKKKEKVSDDGPAPG